jgi:hypothetical protein
MMKQEQKFCFGTLALGHKYRNLAALLAKDIEIYSPNTAFIILTDNPEEFNEYPQVLAFKHQQQGVKCYHDKRFVIAKALSQFNSCIFIDADMRILAPVPDNMQWLLKPGISARACSYMPQKFVKVSDSTADKKIIKEFEITKKATQILGLESDWEKIRFVHEYLFSVTKDSGKEINFLQQWDNLANLFEQNKVYHGEGNAIGLAAYKAGLEVRWSDMEGISFFNEKTETIRVKKGQSSMEEMSGFFEEYYRILNPKQPIWKKAVGKLGKVINKVVPSLQ